MPRTSFGPSALYRSRPSEGEVKLDRLHGAKSREAPEAYIPLRRQSIIVKPPCLELLPRAAPFIAVWGSEEKNPFIRGPSKPSERRLVRKERPLNGPPQPFFSFAQGDLVGVLFLFSSFCDTPSVLTQRDLQMYIWSSDGLEEAFPERNLSQMDHFRERLDFRISDGRRELFLALPKETWLAFFSYFGPFATPQAF